MTRRFLFLLAVLFVIFVVYVRAECVDAECMTCDGGPISEEECVRVYFINFIG
jgi:hypothetical protein